MEGPWWTVSLNWNNPTLIKFLLIIRTVRKATCTRVISHTYFHYCVMKWGHMGTTLISLAMVTLCLMAQNYSSKSSFRFTLGEGIGVQQVTYTSWYNDFFIYSHSVSFSRTPCMPDDTLMCSWWQVGSKPLILEILILNFCKGDAEPSTFFSHWELGS